MSFPESWALCIPKFHKRYLLFLSVRSKAVDANSSILNRNADLKQMGQGHFSTAVTLISTKKSHQGGGPLDASQNLGLFIGSSEKVDYPLLFPWEEPGFQKENNYVTAPCPNLSNTQAYWFTALNWELYWVLRKGIQIKQGIYLGGLCWVGRFHNQK